MSEKILFSCCQGGRSSVLAVEARKLRMTPYVLPNTISLSNNIREVIQDHNIRRVIILNDNGQSHKRAVEKIKKVCEELTIHFRYGDYHTFHAEMRSGKKP